MKSIIALVTLCLAFTAQAKQAVANSGSSDMEPTVLDDKVSSTQASLSSEPTFRAGLQASEIDPAIQASLLKTKSRSVVMHTPDTKAKTMSGEDTQSASKKSSDAIAYTSGLTVLFVSLIANLYN